jgi:competence protein ComFC
MFQRVKENIINFLFPATCLFCRTGEKEICENCFKGIPKQILNKNNIKTFYSFKNEKVNKMLWRLKYHHTGYFAEIFGSELAKELDIQKNYYLIPIPLTKGDKRIHNHAELLANSIATSVAGGTNIKVLPDLLIKNSKIKQAHTKSKHERFENIKNTFSLNTEIPRSSMSNENSIFILIDDISTTGATIDEARKVLEKFLNIPAHEILGIVVAH